MDCSTPGFPVLHHLPELAQTHVHWVGDAIQPSHPLWPSSPPLFHVTGMCPALFGQILPGWPSCSMWVSLFDLASHIAPSRDAPVTATLVLADGKTFYSITHFRVAFPLLWDITCAARVDPTLPATGKPKYRAVAWFGTWWVWGWFHSSVKGATELCVLSHSAVSDSLRPQGL